MSLPAYEKLGSFYLGRVLDATSAETPELMLYDSRDLTTHAVCVGMTGSGKTGLCLSLIEEAAIDGVPALVIDPKGDLTNLLLTFPQLRAEDFLPWVDAGEAARKSLSVAEYAAATAKSWRDGLEASQQDGKRIERLHAAAELVIYTPGSRAGRPLSMLRSFAPPSEVILADTQALKECIGAAVAGLLCLVGVDADPLKSREHILLANILEHAWRDGKILDLAAVIQAIQKPPFDKVGVFDLETFYPAKERLALAMAINNLLAAPGFELWLEGDAIDIQKLLYTRAGKPCVAIVSIAHLNDAERMFVVTTLLNEMVTWMRKQSGTASLRALLYMDEIFGYFPPSAIPPSKIPLLTLMKQARAFGVGVVLATQNPVDLDYKGLSNAGTWFIGRLQTERDKARVIDGLLSAGGTGVDKATLEPLLANLSNRNFIVRNVHESVPVLMRTRWALSYLRGPLTLDEIQKLTTLHTNDAILGEELAACTTVQADTFNVSGKSLPKFKPTVASKPILPAEVSEIYFKASSPIANATYIPYLLGTVRTHFVDSSKGVDAWQTFNYLAPLLDDGTGPDWSAAQVGNDFKDRIDTALISNANFSEVPAALLRSQNYVVWSTQLAGHVYRTISCEVFRCAVLKLSSLVGETEGEFRTRIGMKLRENRDIEVDKLRKKYAPRVITLSDQLRRAQERTAREQSQLSQQKLQAAFSVGSAILGAFLGRKALSATNVGRASTVVRSAGRLSQESADLARATESVEVLQQRLADLQTDMENEIARIQAELDPAATPIESIAIKARKSETVTTSIALAWVPV